MYSICLLYTSENAISGAVTLAEIEDIYRPFKPKRRTRASIAKEKGLEPLAKTLFEQSPKIGDIENIAKEYISEEKGVESVQQALDGANDIIAEMISDNADARKELKRLALIIAELTSKCTEEKESVYSMYYDYSEPISKVPSHRILAMNRGEKEGFLKVSVTLDDEKCINILNKMFIKNNSVSAEFCKNACSDSWSRLIQPSIERELRGDLTDKASEQAIKMFAVNLRPLLMQPPVKDRVVLAVDPAYRTGCKIAVVDKTGKVLDTGVIYPTPPQNKVEQAAEKIKNWIEKYEVDCISIGNGTASKEAEIFIADTIKQAGRKVSYMVVNEAGASVYSASKLGAKEFPDFDVSLRSAVSIARRLQDPLAELVKIDPKAIGVGQYQHDMPPSRLDDTLKGVVEDCVNSVGVDLNTASASLLTYISGLTPSTAANIVAYRDENGRFNSRSELKKVKKLGPKAFEQCAGFLRIPAGKNKLDNTAVHPESYENAEKLLSLFGYGVEDITGDTLKNLPLSVEKFGKNKAAEECGIGLPTLEDMLTELSKPGRDIRDELPQDVYKRQVNICNKLPVYDCSRILCPQK